MRLLILLLTLSASLVPANARAISGEVAYTLCTSKDPKNLAACNGLTVGYLEGWHSGVILSIVLADAYSGTKNTNDATEIRAENFLHYCVPDHVTNKQVNRAFTLYLVNNPHIRHQTATSIFHQAMKLSFPCN